MTEKDELALKLFDIGAVKFGEFRLKLHEKEPEAPLSPIYIDLRVLRSFPRVMYMAVRLYEEMIADAAFDIIADVPTAATPIVAILSFRMGVPMVSPRLTEKKRGAVGSIDGVFGVGQRVLLVDDLITKADSKLEAINVLEDNGLTIDGVAVLLDREQGGVEVLERSGYTCRTAFSLRGLVALYAEVGKIKTDDYDRVVSYLETAGG